MEIGAAIAMSSSSTSDECAQKASSLRELKHLIIDECAICQIIA